ncbi:chemosensory receptor C [Elysia marginata]|uniref:Chemosensory receptor C n=1 Tax=Elysia marginata TaxID=1093978 RepID=A0AAV4JQJ3_9GAST|nr:chemosensory receptor C [Elysia marginata]
MDIVSLSTLNNNSFIAVNKTTGHGGIIDTFVSFSTYKILLLVNGFGFTVSVATFGVFSNTLNVIVYLKLGLRETTNISFFALAIVDLLICVCSAVSILSRLSEVSPYGRSVIYLGYQVAGLLFPCLGMGAFITTVLSAERCLCIVMPLKVSNYKSRFGVLLTMSEAV